MRRSVVVVGGGFAGFWAALAARRVAGDRLDVQLVSRDPLLQMRPRLYEANPETLAVDMRPLLAKAGIGFIAGEAVGHDAEGCRLLLGSGDEVPYSRLVVTTGSRMQRPPIPGADRVHSIDTRAEAMAFDEHLKTLVATNPAPVVAVVGAGFTGIELALEMRDRLLAHGAEAAAGNAEVHLFERADAVGPELGAGPRPVIERALAEAGVEVHLGVTVEALAPDRVSLAAGVVDADVVVLTTGMKAADFAAALPGEHDPLGRLVVTPELRVPNLPNVFAAGDSAAADTGDGHLALQSCQHAQQMGRFGGENAARDLLGLPLVSYAQPAYVTCLDLGRSGAVLTQGWDRQIIEAGGAAKTTKQWINRDLIYPPADVAGADLIARSSLDPAEQGAARSKLTA